MEIIPLKIKKRIQNMLEIKFAFSKQNVEFCKMKNNNF